MAHVDALSRKPIEGREELHFLEILNINVEDWITTVQSNDTEIKTIREILGDPTTSKIARIHKEYKLKNGRVYRSIDETDSSEE